MPYIMSLRFADIRFASGKSVKLKLILLRLGNMQILRKRNCISR